MIEAATLFAANERLASGKHRIDIGRVNVPSGRLYCCDPFLSADTGVLDRVVPPAEYLASLTLVDSGIWGERVAFAALVLLPDSVCKWEQARFRTKGRTADDFVVDAGLACFMDADTEAEFRLTFQDFYRTHPNGNFYTQVLAPIFTRSARFPGHAGDFCLFTTRTGGNIAMFASGLGDGLYCAYWGLNEHERPCRLLVDFRPPREETP